VGLSVVARYLWRLVPRRHRTLAAAIAAALVVVSWQAWSDAPREATWSPPLPWPTREDAPRIVPLPPNGASAVDATSGFDLRGPLGRGVTLPAGTHDVTEAIVVEGPLVITGSGRTSTVLRFVGEGTFLSVAGQGDLRLEGVTVARTSRTPGSVVRVDAGRAELVGVTLTGGVMGDGFSGAGLLVASDGRAVARDSSFEGNAAGVVAMGAAQVDLLRCDAHANATSGVYLRDRSTATIDRCTVRENGRDGIALGGDAVVEVHRSTVEGNAQRGISFLGGARGTVSETKVVANGFGREGNDFWQGIGVQDRSAPELRANEVRGNAGVGIQYLHEAGGLARANTVTGNAANRAAYVAATGLETLSAGGIALGRPGQGDVPDPVLAANRVVRNVGGDLMDYRDRGAAAVAGGG
jgi:hypothetical protein